MTWEKELAAARQAGQEAQQVLLKHLGKLKNIRIKPDAGLVSEADQESEKVIFESLQRHGFPYSFLGEESGYTKQIENQGRWIVDPLDGTTNYVHRFPFYCISIGLEVKGELVVGYVNAPSLGLTFWATQGGGAFQDGQPIAVREESQLEHAFLATGFSYLQDEDLAQQVGMFHRLIPQTYGIRRAGAAALDMCFVASGVFDAFWERGLKPWDTAAGTVIVREAGGIVTDYQGHSYDLTQDTVIAGSSVMHQALEAEIKSLSFVPSKK